jgi:hypothetical protein
METISTKNESGDVVTFSSDNYYTEQKLGSGFTGENSGKTVTEAIEGVVATVDQVLDDLVGSGFASSSITDVIIENEEIVSAALTDLDERKLDASAYTPTDLSNYYTKSETSGKTEIQNALTAKTDNSAFTAHTANATVHVTAAERTSWNAVTAKTDNSAFTAHTASTSHMSTTEKANLDSLSGNIATISGITSAKTDNWDTAYTNNHTHSNKTVLDGITSAKTGNWDTAYTNNHTHSNKDALDSITGNVGTMAYQATSSYSSATQVNTALSGKVNTSDVISAITSSNSGSTNPIATKVVAENELTVSNALTNLDERKLDASAYTPTDLSNYYTKSETSGATEISTALSGKSNTGHTHVSSEVTGMSGYTKAGTASRIETGDTLNGAIGKLEKGLDNVTANILDLSGQSETIAAALVKLNTELAEASANANAALEALSGHTIRVLTQAEYDALVVKDPNTVYMITN